MLEDHQMVVIPEDTKLYRTVDGEELASIPIDFQTVEIEGDDPSDIEYNNYEEENPKETKFARHISSRTKLKSHYGKMEFQSICPSRRTHVILNTDDQYEYRPHSYEEVFCAHPFSGNLRDNEKNRVCSRNGFSCIQLNRTIFISRRMHGSECWDIESRVIASGCDCMWAKHIHGDIRDHH